MPAGQVCQFRRRIEESERVETCEQPAVRTVVVAADGRGYHLCAKCAAEVVVDRGGVGWTLPDVERCQCEWTAGSFMTLGPRPVVRCDQRPTVIAVEKQESKKFRVRGAMSLCEMHREALERQQPGMAEYRPVPEGGAL
jgi:hypothetical protein